MRPLMMRMAIPMTTWLAACVPLATQDPGSTDPRTDAAPDTGTPSPGHTGHTGDTADGPLPPAFPELARDAWTYVPVDGMVCGNGRETGLGINPGTDPTRLVVVVQGGGACWDLATCLVLGTATHVTTGWGEAQMQAETATLEATDWFDRTSAGPWSEATWALIPYCTGDLHAGSRIQSYNALDPNQRVHHVGDANLVAALGALASGVPDAAEAWIVGLSAGGYGVQLHADRFPATFPEADVALLADGAPMIQPSGGLWGTWRTAWSMRLPDGCDTCASSARDTLTARLDALEALDAEVPVGLITTVSDDVVGLYLGYGTSPIDGAVNALVTDVYEPREAVNAFVAPGGDHVLLAAPSRTAPDGTVLGDWVQAWRDRDPAWTDAR